MDKAALRREVVARVQALPPARRALEEELVQAAVQAEPAWASAGTVLLYRATGWELSVVGLTLAAWREGKRTCFPRVAGDGLLELHAVGSWSQLRQGRYGLMEPPGDAPAVAPEEVGLAIVPGVAFDRRGGRLGRGGGYYDRLLPRLRCPKWGVGFGPQVLDGLPAEAHDVEVDRVVAAPLLGLT